MGPVLGVPCCYLRFGALVVPCQFAWCWESTRFFVEGASAATLLAYAAPGMAMSTFLLEISCYLRHTLKGTSAGGIVTCVRVVDDITCA